MTAGKGEGAQWERRKDKNVLLSLKNFQALQSSTLGFSATVLEVQIISSIVSINLYNTDEILKKWNLSVNPGTGNTVSKCTYEV